MNQYLVAAVHDSRQPRTVSTGQFRSKGRGKGMVLMQKGRGKGSSKTLGARRQCGGGVMRCQVDGRVASIDYSL